MNPTGLVVSCDSKNLSEFFEVNHAIRVLVEERSQLGNVFQVLITLANPLQDKLEILAGNHPERLLIESTERIFNGLSLFLQELSKTIQ